MIYQFSVLFPNKTMGIIKKKYFGHSAPGTELPRIFFAGIGPLQLGVVLVFMIFTIFQFHSFSGENNTKKR